jgi:hypothetical protein
MLRLSAATATTQRVNEKSMLCSVEKLKENSISDFSVDGRILIKLILSKRGVI